MNDLNVRLTIDGIEISVPKGTTVYTAAKQLGIDIPIFCYHESMPPFGACRMCFVEVEKMNKLQTSCTLQASEGMVVKTQSQIAIQGREDILEFLLINHPLDCPICDRGGECPLQEQTLKFGPGESRFYEEKRHFEKPLPLGPVLMLDRERCIVCARCTRFGDIVAGDHALEFIERGFKTEVGTPKGGPAESKFIGNTIMLCPVGALTSQVYRFRARPWDNDSVESVCTLCPVGCSMILDSRDGEIVRTRSQENKKVNDIWLCDKGWFGYEFASHPNRLQTPLMRQGHKLNPVSWDVALSFLTDKIKEYKPRGRLAGIGGTTLTTEGLYLFQKLMREVVGVNHVDYRVGMPIFSLVEEGIPPGMEISIGECAELSYAILLGLDITEEFPVVWLRLKEAINNKATVLFFGHYAPEVSRHLTKTVLHSPGKELEVIKEHLGKISEFGKKGSIFIGRQYLATHQRKKILSELLNLCHATPNLTLNIMEGKGNSIGARIAGMHPELGPLEERVKQTGFNVIQMFEAASQDGWDFLHVAGADPAKKLPSKLWKEARAKLGLLVVQDLFLTETAKQADIVLPTLSYVEKRGSFINIERRVQKLSPSKDIPKEIYSDADIFTLIAFKLNKSLTIERDFLDSLDSSRIHRPVPLKLETTSHSTSQSGTLLGTFAPVLFDHGVRMQHNPRLVELAKEPRIRLHPNEGMKRGIKNGSVANLSKNGCLIPVKIKLDEKVAEHTAVIPLGFETNIPVYELGSNLLNGLSIEIVPA
jgi:NADH-quinone oxidoreductase subunit G